MGFLLEYRKIDQLSAIRTSLCVQIYIAIFKESSAQDDTFAYVYANTMNIENNNSRLQCNEYSLR